MCCIVLRKFTLSFRTYRILNNAAELSNVANVKEGSHWRSGRPVERPSKTPTVRTAETPP